MVSCSYLSDRQADPISDYHIQMVMVHIVTVMITTNLAIYFIISDSASCSTVCCSDHSSHTVPTCSFTASHSSSPKYTTLRPSIPLSISTVLSFRFDSSFLPFRHFFFTVSAFPSYRLSISILPLKQIPLSIFVVPSYHFDSSLLPFRQFSPSTSVVPPSRFILPSQQITSLLSSNKLYQLP